MASAFGDSSRCQRAEHGIFVLNKSDRDGLDKLMKRTDRTDEEMMGWCYQNMMGRHSPLHQILMYSDRLSRQFIRFLRELQKTPAPSAEREPDQAPGQPPALVVSRCAEACCGGPSPTGMVCRPGTIGTSETVAHARFEACRAGAFRRRNMRRLSVTGMLAALCVLLVVTSTTTYAQEHLVPLTKLHQDVVAAEQTRQANLQEIDRFLSSEPAGKALRSVGMKVDEVRKGARLLSDTEISSLAARAANYNKEFAAGSLTNQQLTYVVIALGAMVLVLVVVAAH